MEPERDMHHLDERLDEVVRVVHRIDERQQATEARLDRHDERLTAVAAELRRAEGLQEGMTKFVDSEHRRLNDRIDNLSGLVKNMFDSLTKSYTEFRSAFDKHDEGEMRDRKAIINWLAGLVVTLLTILGSTAVYLFKTHT